MTGPRVIPVRGCFACFGVPAAVLILSYVWLAVDRRTPLLLDLPVHESGRYTLLQTIFYMRHFLREIPVDLAMALFVVGGFAGAGGLEPLHAAGPAQGRRLRFWSAIALGAAVALVALAFLVAGGEVGEGEALRELLQFRTRDDLADEYGSHWRFHWLSTIWFGLAASLFGPFVARSFADRQLAGPGRPRSTASPIGWLGWGYVALLSLVFGLSPKIVLDVRFTGHQAREILTHAAVTLPLTFGVLHVIASRLRAPSTAHDSHGSDDAGSLARTRQAVVSRLWGRPVDVLRTTLVLAIPLYLGVVTLSGNFMQAGQSGSGVAAMIAGHAFEHVLDYVLTALVSAALMTWLASRRIAPAGRPDRPSGECEPAGGG